MRAWHLAALGLACVVAYGCGDDDDTATNPGSAGSAGSHAGSAGSAGSSSQAGNASSGSSSGGNAGTTANGGSLNVGGAGGSPAGVAGAPEGGASGGEGPGAGGAGASTGGAADAGGAGGAGGAGPTPKEIQQICSAYAAFYKKVAAATTCADLSAGVKSSCVQGYATNKCVDEAAVYFACVKDRPNTDFQCTNGTVVGKAGVCTTETATYVACASK